VKRKTLEYPELLTPGEVATALRCDPKTLVIWANTGRIPCIKTPGGHRRYRRTDVEAMLQTRGGKP
jgi:excisionase family DNA binding protein